MILVPRSAANLSRTVEKLEQAGLTNLLPFAVSSQRVQDENDFDLPPSANILIFTSPAAIHPKLPKFPVCCVGEETAKKARQSGFQVVLTGSEGATVLAKAILKKYEKNQHFIHACGNRASTSWHTLLQKAGHTVEEIHTYQTEYTPSLPEPIRHALQQNHIHYTLLFSAESAKHLAKIIKNANMHPQGTAVAFSEQVAQVAGPLWGHTVVSKRPTLESVIERLKEEEHT